MIPTVKGRPNLSEYQAIAEHVRQALEEVFYGIKEQNKRWMMMLPSQQRF